MSSNGRNERSHKSMMFEGQGQLNQTTRSSMPYSYFSMIVTTMLTGRMTTVSAG